MTHDEIIQDQLDQCLNSSTKRLTKWEEDFLTSLYDQLARGRRLTLKQEEILERIYVEKV